MRKKNGKTGPVLGLTGGIASGKSTVSAALAELGAKIICADTLARRVVAPGSPALAEIAARFGPEYIGPDGHLDREKMGKLVFADPAERAALEEILHPRIRQAFMDEVAAIRVQNETDAPGRVIVYDAPLLIEAGAHREVDKVLVVTCDRAVQIDRLMVRDGLSRKDAEARIDAQIPPEERISHADFTVDGTLDKAQLAKRLREILATMTDTVANS